MAVHYPGDGRKRLFTRTLPLLFLLSILIPALLRAQQAPQQPKEDPEGELRKLEQVYGEGRESESNEETGEDVRGRQYWFEFQRRYPFDVIPYGAREAALRQMNAVRDRMAARAGASLFSANQWSQVGPYDVGGRVRAMAIDPTNSEVLFVGGASGGVWKSVDGGTTWSTTFDKQSALTIGAITIDPTNHNTIYVGTGELRVASEIGYMADGAYKSTDGGATWKNIGLNNLSAVTRIVVNPGNPNIVYLSAGRVVTSGRYSGGGLGTNDGFYRSTDAGATWKMTQSGAILEISINPDDPNDLLISAPQAIYRSTDAGVTFTRVITGVNNLTRSLRISMAHDPNTANKVYALQAWAGTSGLHTATLYISRDGGTTWDGGRQLDANFFRNQGEYNNCVAVSPDDTNLVMAGGIDMWRSNDGGMSWTNVTRTYGSTFNNLTSHPDQHIIVFDRATPGLVYIGDDGGVHASFDAGQTFTLITKQLAITQFHAVEVDQTRPFRVFGGTQDNQSQAGLGVTAHATAWTRLLGGDGFWVVVDLTDPDIIYAESQYGAARRMDLRSIDNKVNIIGGIPSTDGGAWSTPMVMSPVDNSLWTARTNVYRSANPRGSTPTWTTMTPGFAGGTGVKATALALHRTDARRAIAGTYSGEVRFTTDGGTTWTLSKGIVQRFLTDLAYDPSADRRVYATYAGFKAGHVFKSEDNGANFTNITNNLPDVPANSIEIDPNNNNHLFVGTDIGVFVSIDGGVTWFPFNEGLPVAPVADMRIHKSRRMLVAATHGRSVFEASIDNISVPAILLTPVDGQSISTPGGMKVRWAGFEGPVNVFISYNAGDPFVLAASNIATDTTTIQVPLVRSSTARVKVEAVGGGKSVVSGDLNLTATANIESLGRRGFVAEGIAVRNGFLWATSRGSDTIYKLKMPLLSTSGFVIRSGFSGTVRDLAYDPAVDQFYALVTAADLTSPQLYRVDTNGVATAQISLPSSITTAVGVTVAPQGLVIATAGTDGRLVAIDQSTGAELAVIPMAPSLRTYRRGLIWNGNTFTQGAFVPGGSFPSVIQQLRTTDTARLYDEFPAILSTGADLIFYDLAIDRGAASGQTVFFATDTSGAIFRFRGELFAGIGTNDGWRRSASGASIAGVTPNPIHADAQIRYALVRSGSARIEIVTPDGRTVATIVDGPNDAGSHEATFTTKGLASGLYYVVLSTDRGEREALPVVVVR